MRYIKIILFLALIFIFIYSSTVLAYEEKSNTQFEITFDEDGNIIIQYIDNNGVKPIIFQEGHDNIVIQLQSGINNDSLISQNGYLNNLLLRQSGESNQAHISQKGSNNKVVIKQKTTEPEENEEQEN